MKKLSLREIQMEELELLKIIIMFFKKHNIKYSIFGGTLLGAVRHKGFIPWDDDIDLIIPRPDYEKLIEEIKNNGKILEKNIQFVGYEIGEKDYPFLKLINNEIFVEDNYKWDKKLWIDIFPMDGIKEEKKYFKKRNRIKKIYNLYRYKYNKFPINNNSIKKIVLLFINTKRYPKMIEKLIKFCKSFDYNTSEYVEDTLWCNDNKRHGFIKNKIEELDFYDFEGIKVSGFKDFDYVLTEMYGNYMELPPIEDRITHGFEAWRK